MHRAPFLLLLSLSVLPLAGPGSIPQETLQIEGLLEPVALYRDPWGVSHIYAQNQRDLFFAQGFNAARDRLFQLEIWRRSATGTLAEILGERAVDQDIGARLLQFRGDMQAEMQHYHPAGAEIIRAFVDGINAYVDRVRGQPGLLPLEFGLMGFRPGKWTPEVVVSRHNGLFRNALDEVRFAQLVTELGPERLGELVDLQPDREGFQVAEGLDLQPIDDSVLKLYQASRRRFQAEPHDIVDADWRAEEKVATAFRPPERWQWLDLGSNNWVVGPKLSQTGRPFMVNDPHRSQQIPSLRYFVHLVAPGWDVIGGGEPALPGVSIGHNASGAWGLTIFAIDQEDLYVYETHPDDPLQYRYRADWEPMREEVETIRVKGEESREAVLRFTRHGPVLWEDRENHRAYALKAAWLEVGTAPYLASLRFDQARTWQEFRAACNSFLAPSENMVWADLQGNIGWQATGIAPRRSNWNGLLPVPGDGRHEWDGYLPVTELPHVLNPDAGFFATANQYNLPPGYPHAVGLLWTEPFRFARIQEVLASGRLFSLTDMTALQHDEISLPARALIPLLKGLEPEENSIQQAIQLLSEWDHELKEDSSAAALYMMWERRLIENTWKLQLPEHLIEEFSRKSLRKTIDWLVTPDARFGADPLSGRDRVLLSSLQEALQELQKKLGPGSSDWRWGDPRLHHIEIQHPLSQAIKKSLRPRLDVGPRARGGSGHTVNMTNSDDNQSSGASFRIVVDLDDWDRSLATNAPGQSGDPQDPHYRDLFEMWAAGRYFPLLYSRSRIEAVAASVTHLQP